MEDSQKLCPYFMGYAFFVNRKREQQTSVKPNRHSKPMRSAAAGGRAGTSVFSSADSGT